MRPPDSEPLLRKRQNQKNSDDEGAGMEAREEHQTQRKFRAVYGFASGLGIILLIGLLVWLIHFREGFAWRSDPGREFNWHPLAMILGFIIFYAKSLLIYRIGRNVVKKKLKIIHMSFNLVAFIFAVFGLVAAFDSHNYKHPPVPNLYSLHSWIGLMTVIFFGLQFIIGLTGFFYPGYPNNVRAIIMPIHVASGKTIFLFAVVAAMTGFLEKAIFTLKDGYADRPAEGWLINCLAVLLLFFAAVVLYLVNAAEYKRMPIPEDEIQLQEHTH